MLPLMAATLGFWMTLSILGHGRLGTGLRFQLRPARNRPYHEVSSDHLALALNGEYYEYCQAYG